MVINELNDLIKLKKKIDQLKRENEYLIFDKWLSNESGRNNASEFYNDLISELMTELFGLQVELIDSGQPDKIKSVQYSKEFIEEIIKRIDKRINYLDKKK